MTASSFGPKRQPRFAAGDAPDLSGNPTEVADYAASFGNYMTGTTADRNTATSWAWEGLEFYDTTEKMLYRFVAGVWKYVPRMESDYRSASTDGSGDVTVNHTLGAVPRAVMVTGGLGGTIPDRRTFAPHTLTPTNFKVRVFRQDGNGQVLAGNPVDFHWLASL